MRFNLFAPYEDGLFCAVSNRHGGVSPKPYDTLNVALHVGDDPKNVLQNRIILAEKFDYLPENLIYMEQTHSDHIAVIEHAGYNKIDDTDAIITNQKNIPLMVMVADCIPAMLYDPVQQVIAAVHAGRNGTFKEILPKTVAKMQKEFACAPEDILAALGPSIHSCCYEVGTDLADITVKSFSKKYIDKRAGRYYLDLQTLNQDQLIDTGLKPEHIEVSSICTGCNKNYFSYRREGVTGRFSGVIKLK
jgi:YfiH family protein